MLDADTYRTDLELRLISLSLKDRLIDLTAFASPLKRLAMRAIADMAGLAFDSTWSRLTQAV